MEWPDIKETIRQAVIIGTGFPDHDVVWDGEQEVSEFHGDQEAWPIESGGKATLAIVSETSRGIDETRIDFDPVTQVRTKTQVGNRQVGLNINIETLDTGSDQIASRLRTYFRTRKVLKLLKGSKISLVDVNASIPASYPENGVMVAANVLDVILLCVEVEQVDRSKGTGWIDRVGVTFTAPDDPDQVFDAPEESE